MIIGIVAALIVLFIAGFAVGVVYRKKVSEKEISSAEEEAKRIINEAIKSAENKKRESLLEAKEEIHRNRSEYEREVKERRAELQKQERRLQQKEENLDKKTDSLDKKADTLNEKIAAAEAQQEEVNRIKKSQLDMLEKISGYSVEDAKGYLIDSVRTDVTHEMAMGQIITQRPRGFNFKLDVSAENRKIRPPRGKNPPPDRRRIFNAFFTSGV